VKIKSYFYVKAATVASWGGTLEKAVTTSTGLQKYKALDAFIMFITKK